MFGGFFRPIHFFILLILDKCVLKDKNRLFFIVFICIFGLIFQKSKNMKNIFTFILFFYSLTFVAQAPIFEGTYLPVINTSVKEVWDTVPNSMTVPTVGPNQVWDYRKSSGQFTHVSDTFQIKIVAPSATPYSAYFPSATHASFLRTPFKNVSDSLYSYYVIDHGGLYNIGGFNIKKSFDSTIIANPHEFYCPSLIPYLYTDQDTSRYIGFAKNIFGYSGKIKGTKFKTMTAVGYGTLMLPNANYNNVIEVKEDITIVDSFYVDILGTGVYTYAGKQGSHSLVYEFLRNNTFGSSYLMYLSANPANTIISYGWYSLPVNFGSISGSVYTNTLETTPVVSGEVYLYRENSNFAKNDILATVNLDGAGNYHFDSIPYGEYRIAVRPNNAAYPNAFTTYNGDTTNWMGATSIITTTLTSPSHKIHVRYHPASIGSGVISGTLGEDYSIMRTAISKPIPGVGIVVKKNPGGGAIHNTATDASGSYTLGTLDNGNYELFVDVPGLFMAGTYSFTIAGGTVVNSLDYTVGSYSIHPNSTVLGVKEVAGSNDLIQAYPNPYSSVVTINLNLKESSAVLLEVYNMLGEKVQVLDNSHKQSGNYYYNFSAKSLGFTAGMYFVKLSSGNKTTVVKIVEQ